MAADLRRCCLGRLDGWIDNPSSRPESRGWDAAADRHAEPVLLGQGNTAVRGPCRTGWPCEGCLMPARHSRGNVDDDRITVYLPEQLPVLNERASRILLGILVRLTEVEAPDGPMEGDGYDC